MYNPIPLQFTLDYLDSIRYDGIISCTFFWSKNKSKNIKNLRRRKIRMIRWNAHLKIKFYLLSGSKSIKFKDAHQEFLSSNWLNCVQPFFKRFPINCMAVNIRYHWHTFQKKCISHIHITLKYKNWIFS